MLLRYFNLMGFLLVETPFSGFNHKFFGGTKLLSKNFDSLTLATKTPITAVASSGPEDPAAMKVAPATSGGKFNTILK